jgi:hypothetical protein
LGYRGDLKGSRVPKDKESQAILIQPGMIPNGLNTWDKKLGIRAAGFESPEPLS